MLHRADISPLIKGDVLDDAKTLKEYSRDKSIFERAPALVVFPKSEEDVVALVRYVNGQKAAGKIISIAARGGGSDMSGGPLTDSIVLDFSRYMNRINGMDGETIIAEAGAFYRDIEKVTLAQGLVFPSYPASKQLATLGGMIANNAGGELTLRYGKTDKYVHELEVVLSDGSLAAVRRLSKRQLEAKKTENSFEGEIYRNIATLLSKNAALIEKARPSVTKNSAGYALWDVYDRKSETFDLTELITGSQGTLALITSARIGLVRRKSHRAMLVIFLSDLEIMPEIVSRILAHGPESFESYDDHTFKLAVRFMPQLVSTFGILKMLALAFAFIPEIWAVFSGGVPKLILMAEFAEESAAEARDKAREARDSLHGLAVRTKLATSEAHAEKYWAVRRGSFNLLRKNLHGLYAAPFIDDIVVHSSDYPRFLPELNAILNRHHLLYTIAGHAGDANFHIIPLLDMAKLENRQMIIELQEKVYTLVGKYRGSITGEHNDGIIRTPYLPIMYGEEVCKLFAEVKKIFDPKNIFNPGKKVGGTIEDIRKYMIDR
ncbi:MAG: Oxidoreductase [Parcubacteria group bacterium GW2011_GWA2_51_10]|nr:MAG: Oxidoreductase [Parcubacteria group bacterium GW2011_GWA2_51_10]